MCRMQLRAAALSSGFLTWTCGLCGVTLKAPIYDGHKSYPSGTDIGSRNISPHGGTTILIVSTPHLEGRAATCREVGRARSIACAHLGAARGPRGLDLQRMWDPHGQLHVEACSKDEACTLGFPRSWAVVEGQPTPQCFGARLGAVQAAMGRLSQWSRPSARDRTTRRRRHRRCEAGPQEGPLHVGQPSSGRQDIQEDHRRQRGYQTCVG